MQYQIEQRVLCPHCGQILCVLFCSDAEVTVRDTGISDQNGRLAEREFRHATVCGACEKTFTAFMRVRFYHSSPSITAYDSGVVASEEIGVAFTR